ncbi:MAG: SdrD B-like domain-containing protein [Caldilineaceae bacterium]
MNVPKLNQLQVSHRRRLTMATLCLILSMVLSNLLPLSPLMASTALAAPAAAPLAQTTQFKLNVVSARTEPNAPNGPVVAGQAVTQFKYLINLDNVGDPVQPREAGCSPDLNVATYPDSCDWPSIRQMPGAAPIVLQGDQDDFAVGAPAINLPPGKYLVSVTADGYKIDGTHFTVPMNGPVTVAMQPHPLPAATMRILVFEDNASVNGQYDAPAEHGLAGFRAVVSDILGQVSTDVFGNPLCTTYDANGEPNGQTNCLLSDANGDITIPNLGPNRYDVAVVPPDGTNWTETSTLEGSPSWDTWLAEGGTGLDNEFVVAGEPLPWTFFGFTRPMNTLPNNATGGVKGKLQAVSVYAPKKGGVGYSGSIWDGFLGNKVLGPITDGWVALSDIQNGDAAVYVARANADGTFQINHVPNGDYVFTWWDTNLNYIVDWIQITVANGQMTDIGTPFLTGWFTPVEGYVFDDKNENGVRDSGEPGIANYTVVLRDRDNSEIDRMSIAATTDNNGYYELPKAYPMGSWMMLEAYNDLFYTTGFTYHTDNYITPTTFLGSAVDVSLLPMLGQGAQLDWGVRPYDPTGTSGRPRNGGIVGTVSYEVTRNELDPRYLVVEGWQPGIPNVRVNLYSPVVCGTNPGAPCDPDEQYELASDGSYAKGTLLNSTITEQWEQPTDCIARDVSGAPLVYGVDHKVLPQDPTGKRCLEGPLMATQIKPEFNALNGNYGFADGCFGNGGFDVDSGACADGNDPILLPADDYLVEVDPGTDDIFHRPLYQVTREEDINIFGGDQLVPAVPPPLCAGALHTVDVADVGTDGYPAVNPVPGVTVPASTPVDNPSFAENGGSVYEGQQRPLCDVKLVTLNNGKSIAPTFDFFTDVPVPGKWRGYIIDDLSVSTNLQDLTIGEKTGISHMPIGIYDYNNRLVTTIQSDPNGTFEVLLPSTTDINCPTPSGVCPNVYYMLGNDPGQPGAPNANYNPQFRTIGASFEIYPGLMMPSDLAPTRIVPGVEAGGTTYAYPPQCDLDSATPQIYAVDKPYHRLSTGLGTITIKGLGFGATRGSGSVRLDTANLPITSWTDTQIVASVPITTTPGRYQLRVLGGNGKSTVNGLTYHVIGTILPPFPSTAIADNFSGNNANSFGGGWTDDAPNGVLSTSAGVAHIRTGNNVYDAWRSGGGGGGVLGVDQEAYFTCTHVSSLITTTEQGLLLKFNTVGGGGGGGAGTPSANNARWIEVAYTSPTTNTVVVRTKTNGSATITTQATFPATFAANDRLGARALSDGTIIAYKNGTEIGRTTVAATGAWTGRIGVRFRGTGTSAATEARIDGFGGGNIVLQGYNPNLYEVGPTYTYHTIQSALNAAAASNGADLVVVYPDTPVQWNPLGAYFENVVIYEPVTLQGIGPGGVYANNTAVLGSMIDGRGIAGDTQYSTDWQTFVLSLNWAGVQAVYPGAVVYVLAENNEFTAANSAIVDGFTIQGGDQQGFPNNVNPVTPDVKDLATVQGGGIFVNGYANSMRITNNILRSNGGAYGGAIRLGTPNITGNLGDSNNDNIKILSNRILANGGTNLAGGIGIFRGTDNYEIANNDICGNYSAEYGGGISHYGRSNNGSIHNNRVYFNQSYDEAGGIMIAGELPAVTTQLSPGAGPVDIYSNLIEANLGNDDGGGLRFLMASGPGTGPTNNRTTFAFNVYNNIIVNNISTHEGGGVSINDTPNIRFYNNTVMKNITTATAVTSNGQPAPTGLSSSRNSNLLQATLTGGVANCGVGNNAPCFSNPILFNNIFWDNRAGRFTGADVAGIGLTGDPNPPNYWDLGVADFPGALLSPTNTMLQSISGTVASPTNNNNVNINPNVVALYDTSVDISAWRANPRFTNPIIVTTDATPNQLGDYHINAGSAAVNSGAASKTVGTTTVNAPTTDFDGAPRPQGGAFDKGADEIGPAAAPLAFAAVLDNFNGANGALSSNWSVNNTSNFAVNSQQLQSQANSGQTAWTQSSFGANQEAYVTLSKVGNSSNTATRWQGVNLKVNGGAANSINASAIEVRYSSAQGVQVRTKNAGSGWINQAVFSIAFSDGDQLAAQALADGTVVVFKNGTLVGSINVTNGPNPWPAALAQAGGQIGISYNFSGGRLDDFGGGESTPVVTVSVATEEALGEVAEDEPATVEGIENEESVDAPFSVFMPLINSGDGSNQ